MIFAAIVEDDPLIRNALKDYINLQEDMKCNLSGKSIENLSHNVEEDNRTDVVLIDIGLPGKSEISIIKIIKDKFPDINIISLTVYHDSHKIFQSLGTGASAYLLKNVPFREVRELVSLVHGGGSFMPLQITGKLIENIKDPGSGKHEDFRLTDKEKEILMGLVDGMTYKKIAEKSFISVETVRTHIKNIYQKLHVHSKAEVIRKSLTGEL